MSPCTHAQEAQNLAPTRERQTALQNFTSGGGREEKRREEKRREEKRREEKRREDIKLQTSAEGGGGRCGAGCACVGDWWRAQPPTAFSLSLSHAVPP
jgi:hypothetical protein